MYRIINKEKVNKKKMTGTLHEAKTALLIYLIKF